MSEPSTTSDNNAEPRPENTAQWQQIFSETGLLSEHISGYQPRQQQTDMAACIGQAIDHKNTVIIEAGTGVGKTFAYLVPALMSGQRTIISTGTKTLQDQLFNKDLPVIKKVLSSNAKTALLKGRANYLCLHRMHLAQESATFNDRQSISQLKKIIDWSSVTSTGDRVELSQVAAESEVWSHCTSSADNCLGSDCEYYQPCHVMQARKQAQAADVVVINHHILFADLALKQEGFGDLLPDAHTVIVDEAHHVPEIASTFFSQTLSSRQILNLSKDIVAEALSSASDMHELRELADQYSKAIMDLRLAMDKPGQREAWHSISQLPAIVQHCETWLSISDQLLKLLQVGAERSKGLESCHQRCLAADQTMRIFKEGAHSDHILWFETYSRSFQLHCTPIKVANVLHEQLKKMGHSWVFTSATLSVNNGFEHFQARTGIEAADALLLHSPFDFKHNALMYLPSDLPLPNDSRFVEALVEASTPLIQRCEGGVFMLFTSYRALNIAAELLKHDLPDRTVLVQGDLSTAEMINQFREAGNAVLLGTSSFWEGVDVRGKALSMVIIDKLPFASPGDPVLEARINAIREEGGNPFYDHQLPQAVISLKQGVGRLIRDYNDLGLLVLGDIRIRDKSYGQLFIDSLPAIPKTMKANIAQQFIDKRINVEFGSEDS